MMESCKSVIFLFGKAPTKCQCHTDTHVFFFSIKTEALVTPKSKHSDINSFLFRKSMKLHPRQRLICKL